MENEHIQIHEQIALQSTTTQLFCKYVTVTMKSSQVMHEWSYNRTFQKMSLKHWIVALYLQG